MANSEKSSTTKWQGEQLLAPIEYVEPVGYEVNSKLNTKLNGEVCKDLIDWVNSCFQAHQVVRIEQLSTGVIYTQFFDLLFPSLIPIDSIELDSTDTNACISNFTILQQALREVGCHKEIPIDAIVNLDYRESLQFLHWFKYFYDVNNEKSKQVCLSTYDSMMSMENNGDEALQINSMTKLSREGKDVEMVESLMHWPSALTEGNYTITFSHTLVDHAWSKRILDLVTNKAKLMESFSWLSTVGGGFSALGERDNKFSARAGALSLGQQLHLAKLLGDERLKVMCHLFAALAALQLGNEHFCLIYIRQVIIPLINAMPYRDPILMNILRHICFRMRKFEYRKNDASLKGKFIKNKDDKVNKVA